MINHHILKMSRNGCSHQKLPVNHESKRRTAATATAAAAATAVAFCSHSGLKHGKIINL